VSTDWRRPGFRVLLDWLDGRLDADAAERVAAQVAGADERTVRTVEWLRGFLATARLLSLEEPPPFVRQSLRLHFARWSRARAVAGQQPRRGYGGVPAGARQDVAVAGERAAGGADAAGQVCAAAPDGLLGCAALTA
jgi:hypothetical protein